MYKHLLPTFQLLLPTDTETLFAQACLLAGPECPKAWAAWCKRVGDPGLHLKNARSGIKRLGPILAGNLKRNHVELERKFLSYLHTTYFREELRHNTYRKILGDVLRVLAENDGKFVLLRAPILSKTMYPRPGIRHCHDIDVYLEKAEAERVIALFNERGWTVYDHMHSTVFVRHKSNMLICLHSSWFSLPGYEGFVYDAKEQIELQNYAGVQVHALDRESMLVHILGHAASNKSRKTLLWVCDAWYLIANSPDLDWARVLRSIQHGRLAFPLSVFFHYLKESLNAAIPAEFIRQLDDRLRFVTDNDLERAFAGLRIDAGLTRQKLYRNIQTKAGRLFFLRMLLLPMPSLLQRHYGVNAWALPFLYFYRPVRYLFVHLRKRTLSTK